MNLDWYFHTLTFVFVLIFVESIFQKYPMNIFCIYINILYINTYIISILFLLFDDALWLFNCCSICVLFIHVFSFLSFFFFAGRDFRFSCGDKFHNLRVQICRFFSNSVIYTCVYSSSNNVHTLGGLFSSPWTWLHFIRVQI